MYTLKRLTIGAPNYTINFPFISKEKLMFFKYPNIYARDIFSPQSISGGCSVEVIQIYSTTNIYEI